MAQGDTALYLYENVDVAARPSNAVAYLYENVDVAGRPASPAAYLYENVDVAGRPVAATAYFYQNVLDDANRQFFHFQLRADTASGAADDVSVNVKWVVGGVTTDLGNFTSFSATPTGDAPWRDVAIPVDSVYDLTKTNKAEISHSSSSVGAAGPNLLTANQATLESGATTGWEGKPNLDFSGSSPPVYTVMAADTGRVNSGSYALKITSPSAGANRFFGTLTGTSGFVVTPGSQYLISAWVNVSYGNFGAFFIMSIDWYDSSGAYISRSSVPSTLIPPIDAWTFQTWETFAAPAGASFAAIYCRTTGLNNNVTAIWFDDVSVNVTGTDNAHIRNVWLSTPSNTITELFSSSISSTWQPYGGSTWGIQSSRLVSTTSSPGFAILSADLGSTVQDVQATNYNSTRGYNPGVLANFAPTTPMSNGTYYRLSTNNWVSGTLWKLVNGVATGLGTWDLSNPDPSSPPATPAYSSITLRLTHDGAGHLKGYANGVLVVTATDPSPLTGTRVGIYEEGAYPSSTSSWTGFTAHASIGGDRVDYGSYPKGFDYIEDVEDGMLGDGTPIVFTYDPAGSYGDHAGSLPASWTVPAGIHSITAECWGAAGQDAWAFPGTIAGGKGGYIKALINVTPGEVLKIYPGGHPSGADVGGFNGGGRGTERTGGGTGGGGGSDIRRAPYTLNDRLIVAGGGGGGGSGEGGSPYQGGGHGGADVGGKGTDEYGGGGMGGTQSAGGAGGTASSFGPAGQPGSFGQGGSSILGFEYGQGTGGGGGGWYGGGEGGAQSSGGGGGSNHLTTGTLLSNQQGIRSGQGQVTITPVPSAIMNDGGTLPGAAYYAQLGVDIPPDAANYATGFGDAYSGAGGGYASGTGGVSGAALNGWDGWSNPGGGWYLYGGNAAGLGWNVPQGTFNAQGHNIATHSDQLRNAPKHNLWMEGTMEGSRGSNGFGLVWGYRDANNYWYTFLPHDQGPGEVGRVEGGVKTVVHNFTGGSYPYWGWLKMTHDFITGQLVVDGYGYFLGDTYHYEGNHPWSVTTGRIGILGRPMDSGIFRNGAIILNFSNIYSTGDLAQNKQYSMQTNAVVTQSPATWYFRATKIAKWVVGAVGWS